jgi:hypothetical protein
MKQSLKDEVIRIKTTIPILMWWATFPCNLKPTGGDFIVRYKSQCSYLFGSEGPYREVLILILILILLVVKPNRRIH